MNYKEEAKEAGLPNPMFDKPQEINYEQRAKLMCFNTSAYWWCYYDPKTNHLYNEYCRIIMVDAYSYLLDAGLIDKDKNELTKFQK